MHGNSVSGTREALPLAWQTSQVCTVNLWGYDRDGRVQGVGPLQSTEEAFEQGSPQGLAEKVEGRERAKGNVAG